MRRVAFHKMSGSGNDFIVVDNRRRVVTRPAAFARRHCPRATAVGADGVVLVERSRTAALRMRIINADGSEAEMCGNASRCTVRYAVEALRFPRRLVLETLAGPIHGRYARTGIRVGLTEPVGMRTGIRLGRLPGYPRGVTVHFVNTGVPHVVIFTRSLERAPVREAGRAIRFHRRFAPAGTNVNFVSPDGCRGIRVRTYERGVEDETLACGTGVTASALLSAVLHGSASPVRARTRRGEVLKVGFTLANGNPGGLTLEGPVRMIYRGELLD